MRYGDRRDNRPAWMDVWMTFADTIGQRSRCEKSRVGAVIVGKDQQVISASYNGPPSGLMVIGTCSNWCPRMCGDKEPSPTYDDCPSAHAEQNAIARADYSRMQDATLYVSTSPCKGCAKLAANSGIRHIVYRNEPGREYRGVEETMAFLAECGVDTTDYAVWETYEPS